VVAIGVLLRDEADRGYNNSQLEYWGP
jgi:hypothetical protein